MENISLNPIKWSSLFLLILAAFNPMPRLQAATNVSGNVSGNWTLSGSPYNVTGNIQVAASQILTIEPGVEVIFQGFYRFIVTGQLRVNGNQLQPVHFKAQDTTGWYNDGISNGGWRGIQFNAYQGLGTDSSVISFAIVQDVKHGMNANANGINALTINNRSLLINHCQFNHNQSIHNLSDGRIIQIYNTGSHVVNMNECQVYGNAARVAIIQLSSGKGNFRKNEWYENKGGSTFFGLLCESLIEENEIHHNTHIYSMSALRIDGIYNVVRKNKIHHNTADRLGAIMCTMGQTTIEQNLICNNQTLEGNCGPTDGGGGIHLSHNNNAPWDSTRYLVRNNVIANNHCAFNGGGVYVYDCKVEIYNNHFVNNTAQYAGSGFYAIGANARLKIKNNLFYKNGNPNGPSINQVYLLSCDSLWFDYNWGEKPLYNQLLLTNLAPNYIGDTSHRVVAPNPFLVNPTTSVGINNDATVRDFNLSAMSSSCMNNGLASAGNVGTFDYLGNNRIQGIEIDLGAFEYPQSIGESVLDWRNDVNLKFYPNPVNEQFFIEHETEKITSLIFYNLNGQIIPVQLNPYGQGYCVETKEIPSGIYFLYLTLANNTHRYVQAKVE